MGSIMSKKTSVFLIVILLSLVSCIATETPSESKEVRTVRYVNFKVYDPVYVAIEKGFFEKHGIQVKIIGDVLGGPNAIQAVSAGSAEAGLSSIPAIVNANAAGLPIQGVVDIQTTLEGQSLQNWYVREDYPLTDLADVYDMEPKPTYAVNIWRSSFHYTSLLAFDQMGIPEDCVNWVLLSFSDQIPSLVNGEADIIGLIEPYQTYLEDEYPDDIRMLFNDYDDVYGSRHVSLIFVNRIWAREKPDEAKAFAHGLVDAIRWIEANQDEAQGIISKYTGIPAASVSDYHFTPNGQVRMDDINAWIDWLKSKDEIPDWIDSDQVATNQYVNTFEE